MFGGVRVFRGVTIGRVVTTKRGAAGLTCAQVNPEGANLDALLALASLPESDLHDRFYVQARFGIHDLFLLAVEETLVSCPDPKLFCQDHRQNRL